MRLLGLGFKQLGRFSALSRAPVFGTRGAVATSQPLAALEALRILGQGGNAIDAAVTAMAVLSVAEPMQVGPGGDAFALIFDARSGGLFGLNASGRAPAAADLVEVQRRLGGDSGPSLPLHSVLAVTVPGAVDGWISALERFGSMSLSKVLAPAIRAAEEGFAVAPWTAAAWASGVPILSRCEDSAATWLAENGSAPIAGSRFRNPRLARTLQLISEAGRDAFYRGTPADAIVGTVRNLGGLLTQADLANHRSHWVEPITAAYRGYEIVQLPPNGQGIAVLEAMRLLEGADLAAAGAGSADATHLQIEATKLALHAAHACVADPCTVSPEEQLRGVTSSINAHRDRLSLTHALTMDSANCRTSGDTAFVCVADVNGNFVSFIASLYHPWATGITAGDTGILLQNRGCGFSLDPRHPNVLGPAKQTRHTILPAMVMKSGRPVLAFGFVGGDLQVMGQVQFLCNLIDFEMNAQAALDAPRWRFEPLDGKVSLEPPLAGEIAVSLAARGHSIAGSDGFFAGGQAVMRLPDLGTFQGGSDSRRDGCALALG